MSAGRTPRPRGRPATGRRYPVPITTYLSEVDAARLDVWAEGQQRDRAEAVRQAVRETLDREGIPAPEAPSPETEKGPRSE